ncbi:MAG: UDP-glucose--hexose-1-phosphate uridylyltransferase [Aerococcus sp.]|nr:UDP-glucose--hexose-1-phosphate uridylyltransferase [Aerococcus sp.]
MTVSQVIADFVQTAIAEKRIDALDGIYVRNRLLALLDENSYDSDVQPTAHAGSLLDCMDQLRVYAQQKGLISERNDEIERFEAAVMDILLPKPSEVNHQFWKLYADSPEVATDYFYHLQQDSDYIKTRRIAKNIAYTYTDGTYGDIEITINLSKPEKTPAEIEAAKNASAGDYPQCVLCLENEGYRGRVDHAARQNHRLIRLSLANGTYAMQYSPYVYYNEHCIFLNTTHVPMAINRQTFDNLLEITTQLPHYFVGSNADLPGVGGSILAHDHYQGGRHTFAMEKALIDRSIHFEGFDQIDACVVKWPMTTLRLRSTDREALVELADKILNAWRQYSDESLGILSETDQPHNTITPIARRKGEAYELDLVLRNNRKTAEFPDGLFHPHPDVQHIKQENIGLIEVMGLAILPPRLIPELQTVQDYLSDRIPLSEVTEKHREWAQAIKAAYDGREDVKHYVEQQVGATFVRILTDAGVFKWDAAGQEGLDRFIQSIH